MNQPIPKINGALKGAAFGATLAMLPMAIFILLVFLEIVNGGYSVLNKCKTMIIIQFIGCIIWFGCIIASLNNAKKLNIPTGGLALCLLGILIGGIGQLIMIIKHYEYVPLLHLRDYNSDATAIQLGICLITNLPIAIGTLMAGKSLLSLKRASIGYFLLSVFPLLMLLIFKTFVTRGSSSSSIETATIIIAILLLLLALICVSGWWGAASNARDLEEEYEDNASDSSQPIYVEQPSTSQSYNPAPQPQQSAAPLAEAQRNLLMGMSNKELSDVVNNPAIYTNKTFVEEAKNIMTKRQAWEMIKNYSDEQLLNIVHNNTQGFSYEVLDAASMELFTREAPAFVNEIKALETEELLGIVNNPGAYYDGYVSAATVVLNQRQNNLAQK